MSKAEEYIKKKTRGKINHITENFPWITTTEALEAVKIAREEIYEWLEKNQMGWIFTEDEINNLKRAMNE